MIEFGAEIFPRAEPTPSDLNSQPISDHRHRQTGETRSSLASVSMHEVIEPIAAPSLPVSLPIYASTQLIIMRAAFVIFKASGHANANFLPRLARKISLRNFHSRCAHHFSRKFLAEPTRTSTTTARRLRSMIHRCSPMFSREPKTCPASINHVPSFLCASPFLR